MTNTRYRRLFESLKYKKSLFAARPIQALPYQISQRPVHMSMHDHIGIKVCCLDEADIEKGYVSEASSAISGRGKDATVVLRLTQGSNT